MIDIETPDEPGWMLDRLAKKLRDRTAGYQLLFDRYEGKPIRDGKVMEMTPAFQRFWEIAHTNFAEMVVRAPLYRMSIAAIRTSGEDGQLGDAEAWRMCRRAGLFAALPDALRTMKVAGTAYLMFGKPNGRLAVTAEDPRQVVTVQDPLDQRVSLYGAKFFHDVAQGRDFAYLHTPGRVRVAYKDRTSRGGRMSFDRTWDWLDAAGGEAGKDTGVDVTAIKRLRNDEGVGEFERHTYLLDRIDHITLQGLVIATMQAFKQRALKLGEDADMPDKDEDGNPIDWEQILTAAPDRMWKLPAGVEIWESQNIDLTPIWTGTEKYIQQLSAVTFTPLSMFAPEGQNQSAEGASLAREGLVAKTELCIDRVSEDIADVVAELSHLDNAERTLQGDSIVLDWKPVERYGFAERYQAAVNAKAADVPWRARMAKVLQFTSAEIIAMEQELADMPQIAAEDTSTAPIVAPAAAITTDS